MNILITGGSGYLGRALTDSLLKNSLQQPVNVSWVSRNKNIDKPQGVDVLTYAELMHTDTDFTVIINLAGAGIADARWSDKRKQQLYDSRLQPTQAVLDYLKQAPAATQQRLFMSGSAIGWYGSQELHDKTPLDESSAVVNNDFAHQLCDKWEKLALTATDTTNATVAIIRTGVVMGADTANGGMIARLKLPFSLGLGGQLASGEQMMSWISLRDWVRAVEFIITDHLQSTGNQAITDEIANKVEGKQPANIYNLTAPTAVSNAEFTKAVGSWLCRPTMFKQAEFVLKSLFGEMATLLIDGQVVVPQRLLDKGFEFVDNDVLSCLQA